MRQLRTESGFRGGNTCRRSTILAEAHAARYMKLTYVLRNTNPTCNLSCIGCVRGLPTYLYPFTRFPPYLFPRLSYYRYH